MKYTTASTKKKVTWSDEVHITLDTEAACCAGTQNADVFTITDQEETIPVSLAIPAEPNAEQADAAASAEEPSPNMPVQTSLVASVEATQRFQGGQTLTTSCTQQQAVDAYQEVSEAAPRAKRCRMRKLFYNPYRR